MDASTTRSLTVDVGEEYERLHRRFIATVIGLDEGQLARNVQATPGWSARDVLAHVVGLAVDLNSQRFPDADDIGGVKWTDDQVTRGRNHDVADLISAWQREAPAFADGLRLFGYVAGSHFVADLHAHHQDIRQAAALTPDDDAVTVAVALDHYLGFLDDILNKANWGTLTIDTAREIHKLGAAGSHLAHLTCAPFELLRVLSARRSARQLRSLDWRGDADSCIALMLAEYTVGYRFPEEDLYDYS